MDNRYTKDIGETEIYLKDLIFYLAKRWRSLLVVVLIGALLGGVFSAANSMRTPDTEGEFAEAYEVDEALAEEMELAAQYRTMYEEQLGYVQNSIRMQMNAGSYYQGVLILYIEGGADTGKVSVAYQSLAFEPSLYEDFAVALAYEGDISYLSEVFQIHSKNFDEALVADSYLAVVEDQLTFDVEAADEESCKAMLAVIQDYITVMDEELKESYEDYSIEIIQSEAYKSTSNAYLSKQAEQMDILNTYYNRMTNLEADFTGDDLEYYQSVYLTEGTEDEAILEPEESEEGENAQAESSTGTGFHISLRWVLLGMIGMIVLWAIFFVIRYLMDASIKTSQEVKDAYRLPVLGRIDSENTLNGIDGWLVSLYRRTEEPADSVSHVASVIDAMACSKIALCGDEEDIKVQSVMEKLRQSSDQIECMAFIGEDDQALKRATELEKEVLVVQTGRTTRKEVQRELEFCELQGIEILGVIVIE